MVSQKYRWDFIGLSTDTKPTSETSDKVVNGSTYYCSDTSKLYVYCDGTWYERKPLGGGGGGGTSDFNDLSNRPKYNGTTMTGTTDIPEVKTYTAGTNVTISGQNVISATDTTYSDFTGTDGTAAGTAGLVPAPTTSDTDKYLKSDGSWAVVSGGASYTAGDGIDITNAVISATNTGKARELTTADYNYPTNNPDGIAYWLLSPGVYTKAGGIKRYVSTSTSSSQSTEDIVIGQTYGFDIPTLIIRQNVQGADIYGYNLKTDGASYAAKKVLKTNDIVDDLSSTSIEKALSAKQGKVLKDLIDSLAIRAAGAPTTSTVGSVGTLYEDTTNGKLYQCTDTTGGSYTWEEIGAGGSGPTVVQTTGTSTTDVMSQNAVTSMVFADPSTKQKVQIGHNASASALYSIAIGSGTTNRGIESVVIGGSSYDYDGAGNVVIGKSAGIPSGTHLSGAVALGYQSKPSRSGEVYIGSTNTSFGFNNTNHRVIGGVHDGQSAHDAATVAQGNTLSTSAPTTSTVGVLGQLYTDTTNMHTYQCTAISGDTYTWTQRW